MSMIEVTRAVTIKIGCTVCARAKEPVRLDPTIYTVDGKPLTTGGWISHDGRIYASTVTFPCGHVEAIVDEVRDALALDVLQRAQEL